MDDERKEAVRLAVKEAFSAAIAACVKQKQTHLVCCMVSGGIYTDDIVRDYLFSGERGYASILREIFASNPPWMASLTCVLSNFRKKLDAMIPPAGQAPDKVWVMDGDSITVACAIQDLVPGAKVCIMIAGNAGRPFGGLGLMDRTGLKAPPPYPEYDTQEESVLGACLNTALTASGKAKDANLLYNYYVNGSRGASKTRGRQVWQVQKALLKADDPERFFPTGSHIPLPTRTLVTPDHRAPQRYEGESPWGMCDTRDASADSETVQGFDYKYGVRNGGAKDSPTFDAEAYHFCLLVEQCFVQNAFAVLQQVSFAFVFGPNTNSSGTPSGAMARTLVKKFSTAERGPRGRKPARTGGGGAQAPGSGQPALDLFSTISGWLAGGGSKPARTGGGGGAQAPGSKSHTRLLLPRDPKLHAPAEFRNGGWQRYWQWLYNEQTTQNGIESFPPNKGFGDLKALVFDPHPNQITKEARSKIGTEVQADWENTFYPLGNPFNCFPNEAEKRFFGLRKPPGDRFEEGFQSRVFERMMNNDYPDVLGMQKKGGNSAKWLEWWTNAT